MKTCIHCRQAKRLSEFYTHKASADGHVSSCKDCYRARSTIRRRSNPAVQAYDRERANRPERRENRARVTKAWRQEHPETVAAHNAVQRAIRAGKLVRKPCEVCGTTERIHAHHDDYADYLKVRWLCALHHRQHHADMDRKKAEEAA